MHKLVVTILLLYIAEFVFAPNQCSLSVSTTRESKFVKTVKGWFGLLKKNVKDSLGCRTCDSIRSKDQKNVDSEKDQKTGCRCQITNKNDKFECACCFKLKNWDFLICISAGFTLGQKTVFLVVTVEDQVIVEINISLETYWATLLSKLLSCIPLPPPVAFLSVCFKPSIEKPTKENNNMWAICVQLQIGIFIVPVVSIKPKCFHIGGKSETRQLAQLQWMKLEGQEDPTVSVMVPAESEVIDDNFNPMVCLTNSKKNAAGTCTRSALDCDEPTEMIDEKINWRLSIQHETPFLAVLHREKLPKTVEDVHGDDNKYPFIHSVLNRADQEKWMNASEVITINQPGSTCGGALLTPNMVLTLCACIRTFYYLYALKQSPGDDVADSPFDIRATDIYVDFSGIMFNASKKYYLEKDEGKFMRDSTCAEQITKGRKLLLETSMIVMMFTPKIESPAQRQFVEWPPPKVQSSHLVELVGFGMEPVNQSWLFYGIAGGTIDFETESVDIFMKTCELTNYIKTELSKEPGVSFGTKVAGFCSLNTGFQLCYGNIGLPLTIGRINRQLLGLSSIPIDCQNEGSIAAAVFDDEVIEEISKFIISGVSSIVTLAWLHILLILVHRKYGFFYEHFD